MCACRLASTWIGNIFYLRLEHSRKYQPSLKKHARDNTLAYFFKNIIDEEKWFNETDTWLTARKASKLYLIIQVQINYLSGHAEKS
jgi:hypothetical protein